MKIIKRGPKPKGSYLVTAASTRARESIARVSHGKVNLRKGPSKITGKTGLKPVQGGPNDKA